MATSTSKARKKKTSKLIYSYSQIVSIFKDLKFFKYKCLIKYFVVPDIFSNNFVSYICKIFNFTFLSCIAEFYFILN